MDEAKLNRIPIERGEVFEAGMAQGAQAALTIGFHIVGENWIGEHWDVAENVMENIGLLDIIELIRFADEVARWEASIGQVIEKNIIRNEAGYSDDAPAREALEFV